MLGLGWLEATKVVEVTLPDGPVLGAKVWGQPEAPSTVQMVSRLPFRSNMLRLNVPKSPKKVTLVRLLSERRGPNGRNAVWNGHAGEAVSGTHSPNGRNAVANGHAGEAVVTERIVPNGRNAVWNGHAGEAVVRNA